MDDRERMKGNSGDKIGQEKSGNKYITDSPGMQTRLQGKRINKRNTCTRMTRIEEICRILF